MSRPRHWINRGIGGDTVFVTTTVLDFVHAFRRDEPRDRMVKILRSECKRTDTALHAFVVMPHHVHFVAKLPESLTVHKMMQQFKLAASAFIVPILTTSEKAGFDQQRGLNRHTFWQRSFRSFVIASETVFWQKVSYVHSNPVRSGYAEQRVDYRWSSAALFEAGAWSAESGLEL